MTRTGALVVLALAMCTAIALPARAQSVSSVLTEADSAAVLSIVVDEVLRVDSASDPIKPYEWKDPEARISGHPRVFVRIANMTYGAWAKPSIARLHAWHWRYNGWAIDSTQSQQELTDLAGRSYPVILGLRIASEGGLTGVGVSWDPFTCELRRNDLRPVTSIVYLLARSPSGWRLARGQEMFITSDVTC